MGYVGVITHLLTFDPNFQRDIQPTNSPPKFQFQVPKNGREFPGFLYLFGGNSGGWGLPPLPKQRILQVRIRPFSVPEMFGEQMVLSANLQGVARPLY